MSVFLSVQQLVGGVGGVKGAHEALSIKLDRVLGQPLMHPPTIRDEPGPAGALTFAPSPSRMLYLVRVSLFTWEPWATQYQPDLWRVWGPRAVMLALTYIPGEPPGWQCPRQHHTSSLGAASPVYPAPPGQDAWQPHAGHPLDTPELLPGPTQSASLLI